MARKKRKDPEPSNPEGEAPIAVEEESDYEKLLHLGSEGLLVVEPETRQVLWLNQAAERLLRKKRDKVLSDPFPEELDEGPMRTLDLNKKVHAITWQDQSAALLVLTPMTTSAGSFALEWRLEAAEERAREAEERVHELEAQLKGMKSQSALSPDREHELQAEARRAQERLEVLEREMRQAEERADRAEERVRLAESLMEEAETQAQETERSMEDLRDSVDQVEEELAQVRRELEAERSRVQELQQGGGESERLHTENESLREQVQVLEQEIDAALRRESGLKSEAEELRAQAVQKQESWSVRESEMEELELVHLQAITELEQLRLEKQTWEESAAQVPPPGELEELREQLRDAKERLDFLEIERAETEEKWLEAKAELEKAQEQAEKAGTAQKRCEELELQNEELTLELDLARADLETHHEKAEAREAELLTVKLELARKPGPEVEEQLRRDLEAAQSEESRLRSQVDHLEMQVLELQQSLEDERSQFENERQQIQEVLNRVVELESQLEEAGDRARGLVAELASSQQQFEQLQQQQAQWVEQAGDVEGLRRDFEDVQSHLLTVEKERDQYLRKLDEADEREQDLRRQLESQVAEVELQSLEAQELRERVAELEAARAAVPPAPEVDVEALQLELERLKADLEEAQNQALEAGLAGSEAETLRRQVAELESALAAVPPAPEVDVEALQLELEEARELSEHHQLELERLKAELEEAQNQALEAGLAGSEAETLRRQVAELESALAAVPPAPEVDVEALQLELEEARERSEQHLLELERLKAELDEAQNQALEAGLAGSEAESLRQHVAELEAALATVPAAPEVDFAALELERQHSNQQIDLLQAELDGLRTELEAARNGSSEATQAGLEELDSLRQQLAEREAQARLLHEQLDDLVEQVDQLPSMEARAAEISSQLEQSQERARDLERQVDLLQEELLLASSQPRPEPQAAVDPQELEGLRQQLEDAQSRVEAAEAFRDRAESLQLEVDALTARLAEPAPPDLSPRLAELEAELEGLREELRQARSAPAPAPASEDEKLKQAERLAFEDSLTQLPNLNLLKQYLDFSLKQVDRYQRKCALIHIDLDRFQALNEGLGHATADEVLRQVAQRLQKVVRTSDVLCRKSDDEFLILLSEVAGETESPESIAIVLKRIQEMLAPPIVAGQQPVTVTASIGVSQYPSDAKEPEQMLEHAAIAVKRAKELGRNQAQFYTEELQKRHEQRLVLETELRKSVDQRHFTLLYQPIVHLSTGRIAGVEALLRWSYPSYGVLTPDYFLEVADEIGLMNPIGKLVIAQAAQQLNDWARQGLDMFVTVNLSTRQFLQADLVDTIRRALEATGAPPHNFVVEIPESVQMLDPQRVQAILLALRQAGIRVALDRFGSGFSSLERLHAELITLLKIDRKFLFHAASNAAALNVTVAALGLARSLRLRPVAVGVENETQLSLCRQLECEYVQGNLVYVPTEAAQISEMARAGRLLR